MILFSCCICFQVALPTHLTCKDHVADGIKDAGSEGESSDSDASDSSSSSSGSSHFGLEPAPGAAAKKRKSSASAKPASKAKAAVPRPEGAPVPEPKEDPKILEEARQALRMLDQLTPAAMWKNAIKEKDRSKRLEAAGKKADALALAMTSMQEPAHTDAKQVHDKINVESVKVSDLSTLFEAIRGCQDFPDMVANGPLSLAAFKHLDNDTLSSILMTICTKLLEARLRQRFVFTCYLVLACFDPVCICQVNNCEVSEEVFDGSKSENKHALEPIFKC
jgi:hypothetical protein